MRNGWVGFGVWFLAACAPNVGGGDPSGGSAPDAGAVTSNARCDKMDIVFIIDDSDSMSEEQQNLADNYPRFAQILDDYQDADGNPLDYRLAITTTGRDMHWTVSNIIPDQHSQAGDNGNFVETCAMPRRWLERTDQNLESTFACAAEVGTDGPPYEMPLYTLTLALRERIADGANAGFLRDDALLAIVIITDEDDCSRTDNDFTLQQNVDVCAPSAATLMPADTIAFLDQLKGDRGRWAATVIAGETDCDSQFGHADQATRLKNFVAEANSGAHQNAVFSSICAGTLTTGLTQALDKFDQACDQFHIGRPR